MSGSDPRPLTDLGVLAQDARYELTLKAAESEEQRTARLQREGWEHKVKLLKEMALFLAALLGAVVIVYYCLTVLNDPAAREDTQKWAMSILSAAVSGIVGYLLGKRVRCAHAERGVILARCHGIVAPLFPEQRISSPSTPIAGRHS